MPTTCSVDNGGTPLYARQWNRSASFKDNLRRLYGDPASPLVDAARLILQTDIGDADVAYRVLAAVGSDLLRRIKKLSIAVSAAIS